MQEQSCASPWHLHEVICGGPASLAMTESQEMKRTQFLCRGDVQCTPLQGMLDDSMDIYATTASNAYESSWGTYCPGMTPPPPLELTTCMGDLYSVAWLENRCPLLIP